MQTPCLLLVFNCLKGRSYSRQLVKYKFLSMHNFYVGCHYQGQPYSNLRRDC